MGDNQANADANIIPGKILYLRAAFPHDLTIQNKYFVVVGMGEKPLLLKINSVKNISKVSKKFREFQFTIKPSQYKFLEHDSYIDCGTVWCLLSRDEISAQLISDPRRIIGDISNDHKNEIIRLTHFSKSISPIHKKSIVHSLSGKNEVW